MTVETDPSQWPLIYQLLSGLIGLLLAGGGTFFGVKKYRNGNGNGNGNGGRIDKNDFKELMEKSIRVQNKQTMYMKKIAKNTSYLVEREKRREILEEAED